MSKGKKLNIESESNFYTLLCNLGDKDKSIVLEALASEKKQLTESKELVLSNIDNVDKELSFYKKNFAVFEKENQHAIDFLFSFDNDYGLQEYFTLIGVDLNFLNDVRKIVTEEANTGAKFKIIKDKINDLHVTKDRFNREVDDLDSQLKENKKKTELSFSYASDLGALIEGSINENGTFNKDYVKGLLVPISEMASNYNYEFGSNFIDRASKAIFFPKDGLEEQFKRYVVSKGNIDSLFVESKNEEDIKIEFDDNTEEVKEDKVSLDNDAKKEDSSIKVEEEKIIDAEPIITDDSSLADIEIDLPEDFSNDEKDNIEAEEEAPEEHELEVEEQVEEKESDSEMPVEENNIDENIETEDNSSINKEATNDIVDIMSDKEPDLAELLVAPDTSSDVDAIINNCKLDNSMVNEDLRELLRYSNEDLVIKNFDTLRAINLEDNSIYYVNDDYSYLTDEELVEKINYLRGKGIVDKVIITALKNHYLDTNFEKIKNNVKVLEDNGIPFDKEYLVVMSYDLNNYVKAINSLAEYGIEPDDVEKTQYLYLLTRFSNNIIPNTEILKNYGISLLRKNGKYALEIYSVAPDVLQQNIDQILETGEVDLVDTIPEVLALNADTIVERINYLKDSNQEYKNGNVYSDVVYKPMAFRLEFGDNVVKDLVDLNESNNKLSSQIGNDYCSVLIEILGKYYSDPSSYMNLELDQDEQKVVDSLNHKFIEEFGAKQVSKGLYKLERDYISKTKFDRNLNYLVSVLLKNGQEVEGNYSEILLVSAYYNKRIETGSNFDLPREITNEINGGASI